MLAPEVWNFPEPKILKSLQENVNTEGLKTTVNTNNFYEKLIITIPDEIQLPSHIEEFLKIDQEYYKLSKCLLAEFLEPEFVNNFITNGKLSCLSVGRNCIVDNCAAITPNGVLTLHIVDYIYQCLGIEGKKTPKKYYEIQIDLKSKLPLKIKENLKLLGLFDFHLTWEPHNNNICPSSVAKYFSDRNVDITVHGPQAIHRTPSISEVPSIIDAEPSEIVEWMGMLLHNCDLTPKYEYVSSYSLPESEKAIKTTRIIVSHVKGYYSPSSVYKLCELLEEYVKSRDTDNYWVSVSIQTFPESLWRWDCSSPQRFQTNEYLCTVFFTNSSKTIYSVGQIHF